MNRFSNPSLLNLQALFIDNNDSHAQHGVHIRISHNPLLGLPTMPFIVQRADIDQRNFKRLSKRTNAIYHNQHNKELIPPFTIALGDEITVTLPSGPQNTAIWAELKAEPSPSRSRLRRRPLVFDPVIKETRSRDLGRFNSSVDLFSTSLSRLRTDIRADLDLFTTEPKVNSLKVTAYLQTVSDNQEYALLGSRSKIPFSFSGTGIKKLVVRGKGTIEGIEWLNAHDEQEFFKFVTIDLLNLPHAGGERYAHLPNWESLCDARRNEQTPKRLPLQDTHNVPTRFSAPYFSPNNEKSRVDTLFKNIQQPLDNLINHPTPQILQEIHQSIVDKNGDNVSRNGSATMRIQSLGLVLQSQLDPGVASYMGYKTLDRDHIKNSNSTQRLSFYRVVGVFNDPIRDKKLLDNPYFELLYNQAIASKSRITTDQAIYQFYNLIGENKIDTEHLRKEKSSFLLQGIAVADHFSVLDPIERVTLKKPRHLNWLPNETSHPIRSIETEIANLVATAGLAVKLRQAKNSNHWQNRNSFLGKSPHLWRTLLLAGIYQLDPKDRSSTSNQEMEENFIADKAVGAEDFRQYVAQMDRFGRYSEWANVLGDKGPRPKPPRPTVLASYQQPKITTGNHQGEVTATVPLPEEESLAPASFPLSHVELTVTSNNSVFNRLLTISVTDKISIYPTHPNPPLPPNPAIPSEDDRFGLTITFKGPTIPTTSSRNLEITAVWIDTNGRRSPISEPAKLIMYDPYPPEQIPIADVLEYTARPDATKKAWVERQWSSPKSDVQYAVYYTDENRLRDYLRTVSSSKTWASTLLTNLDNETDLAIRATLLKAENSRFPDHLYERLKDVIETKSGTTGFRHALSGSLRVLSGYKIVTEAITTTARPELSNVDVVFYGVPNSDPPARPSIKAKLVKPNIGEPDYVVEITVTLRGGFTQGEIARIRRTRSGVIDPLSNPIVGTANFSSADPITGLQTAIFRDIGSALIAPNATFFPFMNYAWIAEAQGTVASGSSTSNGGSVAGLWSRPSTATNLDLIPPTLPDAPIFIQQNGNRESSGMKNLTLEFSYSLNLVPTSLGVWRIRVERILPNEPMTLVSENSAKSGLNFIVRGDMHNPNLIIPYDTKYKIRLIDPIGREGLAVEHIVL